MGYVPDVARTVSRKRNKQIRKLEKAVAVSGVSSGVLEENSGKVPGKLLENFSKANLPVTLGPHCWDLVPTFRAGFFFEIDSSSLLEYF